MSSPNARKRTLSPEESRSEKSLPAENDLFDVNHCLIEIIKKYPSVWFSDKGEYFPQDDWEKIAVEVEKNTGVHHEAITMSLIWSELKSIHQECTRLQLKYFDSDRMNSLFAYIYEHSSKLSKNAHYGNDEEMSVASKHSLLGMEEDEFSPRKKVRSSYSPVPCHGSSMVSLRVAESFDRPTSLFSVHQSNSFELDHNVEVQCDGHIEMTQEAFLAQYYNSTQSVAWFKNPLTAPKPFSLLEHVSETADHFAQRDQNLIDRTLLNMAENNTSLFQSGNKPFDDGILEGNRIYECIRDLHICQKTYSAVQSLKKTCENSVENQDYEFGRPSAQVVDPE